MALSGGIDRLSGIQPGIYRIILTLSALEGATTLAWLLSQPSSGRSAWLLGYSPGRAALLALTLALTIGAALLALLALLNQRWLASLHLRLERHLLGNDRLLSITSGLFFIVLLQIAFLAVGLTPQVRDYSWYSAIFPARIQLYERLLALFDRLLPLLIWSALHIIQVLIALALIFAAEYRRPGFWKAQVISNTFLTLSILVITLAHWALLRLQLPLMKLLPGYYWEVHAREFNIRYGIFLALLALALLLTNLLLKIRLKPAVVLVLLLGAGYTLQVGFGFIEGRGFEYLRLKYADTGHSSYVNIAAGEQPDLLAVVREYEQRYGWKMFPSTKPPGVVLFFSALEHLVNAIQPAQRAAERVLILTRWMAYLFPLIAFLVLGVILLILRSLGREQDAWLFCILYLCAPNVILIPLFLDQVLYPLLFTLGVLLIWQTVKRRSIWLALFTGLYCYCAVFFTFSLLTLLPLFFVVLGLDYWTHRRQRRLLQTTKLALTFLAGIAALYALFYLTLNYNFIERYTTAMRVVRNFDFVLRTGQKTSVDLTTTTVQPSPGQIVRAALLNNLELATAVGFPIFLLFLRGATSAIWRIVRRRASDFDLALGALCLTYLALNLYGQVQGEVARLWIFWVPMLVMSAASDLTQRFRHRTLMINLVVLLQLITTLMIFKYQDFLV